MAVAKSVWGYIEQRELRFMRRVNRWHAPRAVRICMLLMSRLGDGLLWYALALFVLIFGGQRGIHAFVTGGNNSRSGRVIGLFRQMQSASAAVPGPATLNRIAGPASCHQTNSRFRRVMQ